MAFVLFVAGHSLQRGTLPHAVLGHRPTSQGPGCWAAGGRALTIQNVDLTCRHRFQFEPSRSPQCCPVPPAPALSGTNSPERLLLLPRLGEGLALGLLGWDGDPGDVTAPDADGDASAGRLSRLASQWRPLAESVTFASLVPPSQVCPSWPGRAPSGLGGGLPVTSICRVLVDSHSFLIPRGGRSEWPAGSRGP